MPFSRDRVPLEEVQGVRIHVGAIPSTPILWPPDRHKEAQIQQTKGSAKPQASFVLPTTQPSRSISQPRTTPAFVDHVRIVTSAAVEDGAGPIQSPCRRPVFCGRAGLLEARGTDPAKPHGWGREFPVDVYRTCEPSAARCPCHVVW